MIDEPSMDQAFLQKLKEIVEENLGNEQFGVKDLARAAGMSRSKIHRKLQKITSQSTSQFIREIRLDHAFEMLQNQVATVSEISYRVGFSSPTYFSKCFHEYYGFPPRDAVHKPADDNNEKTLASAVDTIIDGPKKTPFPIFYSISFIFVLLLLLSGYYYYQNWINPAHPERESIAVLPLHNFTGEDDQAFFVDGMHDALIGELGQLGNFRVISRTSTLRFRNTELSIKEIARILAVDNIVEGSVYRAEDSVRVQIQLIDPEPEEQHLWAKSYDRNTENILSLLSEVTRDIAQNVQVTLSPVEDSLLANRRQVNPEAYKAYLRGSYLLDQFTPESYEKGISYLLEATRIDPADPLPWARLALGYNTSGHGIIPAEDAYTRAQVAADRALKLDNTLGEVHLAQAVIALYSNWDWNAAAKHFKQAMKFDPNIAEIYAHYSWFMMLKGAAPQDILQQASLAVELDPFTELYTLYVGFEALGLGMPDEAFEAIEKSLDLNPDYAYGYYVLGSAYVVTGDYEQAIKAHQKAIALNPSWKFGLGHGYAAAGMTGQALEIANELSSNPTPIAQWGLAEIYTELGDYDKAFRWLEAAYEARFSWMPWIEWNPNFEPLYNDPRFLDLLERMDVRSRSSFSSNF